ncbi:hypothetical protein HZC00_05075 [Candidatus Kaiserbacteria bacterium]|nr:hypothetical protein [Candidatus Kaiserbacteria bacterium]
MDTTKLFISQGGMLERGLGIETPANPAGLIRATGVSRKNMPEEGKQMMYSILYVVSTSVLTYYITLAMGEHKTSAAAWACFGSIVLPLGAMIVLVVAILAAMGATVLLPFAIARAVDVRAGSEDAWHDAGGPSELAACVVTRAIPGLDIRKTDQYVRYWWGGTDTHTYYKITRLHT